MDESEKENSKTVYIQDKNSGLFVSFDLKNDENFNKAIISLLKNLKKMKSKREHRLIWAGVVYGGSTFAV